MESITIFGITFGIDPVAFTIPIGDGWSVHWYGIIIAFGMILAMLYGFRRAKSFDLDPDRLMDAVLVTVPCAILGARMYHCIFFGSFKDFFDIKSGGLGIFGGIIVAVIVGALMCKLRKINILSAFDLASLGFLIGQCIGRWGNFVNQEVYGVETGSSWFGMTGSIIADEIGSEALVHPCFLYESIWCLIGFIVLHFASKKRKYNGQIALMYVAWYCFGRFFFEGLRNEEFITTVGENFHFAQLLSALLCVAAVVGLLLMRRKQKEKAEDQEYTALFEDTDIIEMETENEQMIDLSMPTTDENEQASEDENGTDN